MKNSRMFIIATTAICGIAFASVGISQTKTTTTKTSKTAVPNGTKAGKTKVDVTQKETNEQRLRRLKNDKTESDCIELLEEASGGSVEYNEGQCSIKIKKGSQYLHVYLEKADVSVSVKQITATCRSSNKSQCVSEDGPDVNKGVGSFQVFFKTNADATKAKKCLDFLHQRCKDM